MSKPNETDITGNRFGLLTAVRRHSRNDHLQLEWEHECDCGKSYVAFPHTARESQNCGCQTSDKKSRASKTHGRSKTTLYKAWHGMTQRCINKQNRFYRYYGGRGIKVCDRWMDFENFLKDMGERPEGYTIERIDNNEGYNPNNCKWATRKEQQRNRRVSVLVTVNGAKASLEDACNQAGIHPTTIRGRIKRGATPQEAFDKPVNSKYRKKSLCHLV